MLRITVLVEDTANRRGLLGEHGLSLLVERGGDTLLFDAGQGLALLHNARSLKVDWERINRIALSHGHYDHAGGLPQVLSQGRAEIFLHPHATISRWKRSRERGIEEIGPPWRAQDLVQKGGFLHYQVEPVEIQPGMWLTGPIPRSHPEEASTEDFLVQRGGAFVADSFLDDQALVLQEEMGLVVILGCGHSGLINTLDYSRKLTGEKRIRAVIGGIHLLSAPPERIEWTIQAVEEMDIPELALGHCTGFPALSRFRQVLGERVYPLRAGDSWPREVY
jgi:7,8-dihydropterin-6-yl-methyl-4-(beta-D-ribofuranosyl)aminobenzene 5'-phosphate synthase